MSGLVRQTVAYADTDAGGVMYHGRYIELAERSRLRWMLDASYSLDAIARELDVLLAVHKLEASFHRPARLEDDLIAMTTVDSVGAARSRWRTEIRRGFDCLASIVADVVAVSASGKTLTRIPDELLRVLSMPGSKTAAAGKPLNVSQEKCP